ncbi:hydrogenase maturation factor hoxX [Verticillium alfalfae VaMs.102]|uniref:Hydrogenase maturation factor hoxX n=1 Tax=Verticillium alfalfae (strain VaMs.102 / ATCC MYA-4576 / FGSC 10136) TaxID=526221 RepID=C9SUF3_VERA1|nr:hydrogenase maturation factor hoxX [Verticillium alfalfae VaMs.102]EEY22464.1 hydrogenase maturation factor hoxX [Verticillium alfalfae VaMs.102]
MPEAWRRAFCHPQQLPRSAAKMNILFLCTAHNSLSQRLYLALAKTHSVTIEYALSDQAMVEAVALAQPDLIICPFLTSRVPNEIYLNYLTLIVHPGPPGDAGPSALDWVLMGDDGSETSVDYLLQSSAPARPGRSHWGVTVLQAVEEFDAGPVWAFEQFPIDIDAPDATKSNLYRGPVTRAALTATLAALERISTAASRHTNVLTPPPSPGREKSSPLVRASAISPRIQADPVYRQLSVTLQQSFLGGVTRHRPLLKASQRDFDMTKHTARDISRRIRSADSQPGCLTGLFGSNLFVYGGTVEEAGDLLEGQPQAGTIIACRDEAICVATCDGKGIWISHIRRTKRKVDAMLWPKVPAVSGLRELGLLDDATFSRTQVPRATVDWSKAAASTHQEIWVDFTSMPGARRVAFVYFEFYNGAMSTSQCDRLVEALEFVARTHLVERPLSAVVLMGGNSYFSNGIALNVIEASADPGQESWRNINRIDDVVQCLLDDFPRRNIKTVAAIRGNCAAGGVALAAACDVVIAGSETVLNPAYRALGLHGSEYHSLSYTGRCGVDGARRLLRDMTPLSAYDARAMGLIDHSLPGSGKVLDARVRNHVKAMVCGSNAYTPGKWKSNVDVSPAGHAAARAQELGEMAKDFWSARAARYHERRRDFVRKIKARRTPLRFAGHRRLAGVLDEEESDSFDDVGAFERRALDRLVEERLRQVMPMSPTDSALGSVDGDHHAKALAPTVICADVPTRDLGPVFSCYYGSA